MTNLYITPAELREALKLDTSNSFQVEQMVPIIRSASRWIDEYLGRHFYSVTDTRYYDGNGTSELYLPDDVISITTLKIDDDDDGTYETTLTEGTDFLGWPYNGEHFRRLNIPTGRDASLSSFPPYRKSIEIVGKFGWSEETKASGVNGTVADATTTTIDLDADPEGTIAVGHTVLIESEQMYVEQVNASALVVQRAVNGTTGASHSGVAVSIIEYAGGAVRNEIIAASTRWYREFATGFSGATTSWQEGGYASFRAMWPAIVDGLATYRHPAMVAGVL